MKKRFILLSLLFLLLPVVVNAEEAKDVKITNIELIEKSAKAEEINAPTFSLNKVNFNLKFTEVGDYAKYKLTIKNEGNATYELTSETKFTAHKYMKYEFSHENDLKNIKPGDTATIYVSFSYNKEVPADQFVDGKYEVDNSAVIELADNALVVTVPNTTLGYSIIILVAIAVVTIIFLVILFIYKKDNPKTLVIILSLLLLLPLTAYAAEKISILFESKIVVEGNTEAIYAWNYTALANKGSAAASSNPTTITHLTKGTDYITEADYPTYESRVAFFGKNDYLKYDVASDEIINTYACIIYNNAEHCLKGADGGASFAKNTEIIKGFQAYYNLGEYDNSTKTGCTFKSYDSYCGINNNEISVSSDSSGGVDVSFNLNFSTNRCTIYFTGNSYCGMTYPVFSNGN